MHAQLKVHICAPYTHAFTTKHTCHHQTPPKHKIYVVGLPSVLYETPGQNERSVLNQLFLVLLFSVLFTFQVLFYKNCNGFHMKFCELLGYHQV